MGNLADFIEQYLSSILASQSKIELKRQELAKMFRCAPSQINYVLETRFTFERGFLVESKRGGGGYIRISQIPWRFEGNLPDLIEEIIPESTSEAEAEAVLAGLVRKEILDLDEAQLCFKLVKRNFADLPAEYSDEVRAKFIKSAVLLILGIKD